MLAAAGSPCLAAVADDGSYSWFLDAGAGHFSGEYGLPETTTMDMLNFSARRYLSRGEVLVSVPVLRIDGPADIRFVGGQPVSVPGVPPPDGEFVAEGQRTETGIGDVTLQGEYYLLPGTDTRPWVIGMLRAKLPTGSEDKGLSTGAADVEAGVSLIQQRGALSWLADLGYTWVGSTDDFRLRDVLRIGSGASLSYGTNYRHSVYVYLENQTHMVSGFDDRRTLTLGAGTALGDAQRLRLSGSVFVGLSDTAEDFGLYLTVGQRY